MHNRIMPHYRIRYTEEHLEKMANLWPVVGVVGARQVGKTTFLGNQLSFQSVSNLDEESIRSSAQASASGFLSSLEEPALIDEVQRVPKLFEALKLSVDKKRRPGRFFLTGSVSFSEGAGIRESLTGRIGVCHLHPLTLGEAHQLARPKILPLKKQITTAMSPRIHPDSFSEALPLGGMPVPMFIRDPDQRKLYWQGWLSTTILRDMARLFKRGFQPEFAYSLLEQIGKILRNGELPTTAHFRSKSSRKLSAYLHAFEAIFVLRRLAPHDLGTGKTAWLPFDSGLGTYLAGNYLEEGARLSLSRILFLNEISALFHATGENFFPVYYKSPKAEPCDLVVQNIPIKIVPMSELGSGPWGWYASGVKAAAKKLGTKQGVLVAPILKPVLEKDLVIAPWTLWS